MATMITETVNAEWIRDRLFLLRDRNDFPVVMTQPMGVSGADLLPMSLLGCVMWDTVAILQKKRQKITGLRASAESKRDPEPPWIFREIRLHYVFVGKGLDAKQVERALELSQKKYCSIYATLRQVVKITHDFEILEA
ncbi:MAG: OsmC family protein [Chloroflexota bacterium]